jgi:hypothetical protein
MASSSTEHEDGAAGPTRSVLQASLPADHDMQEGEREEADRKTELDKVIAQLELGVTNPPALLAGTGSVKRSFSDAFAPKTATETEGNTTLGTLKSGAEINEEGREMEESGQESGVRGADAVGMDEAQGETANGGAGASTFHIAPPTILPTPAQSATVSMPCLFENIQQEVTGGYVETTEARESEAAAAGQEEQGSKLSSEHLRNGKKRARPDGEGTAEGEGLEQEPEAATANSSDPSVSKRHKRRQTERARQKLRRRTDAERSTQTAADLRISMKMGNTYEGVIVYMPFNVPVPRASVLIEGTLMGFCDIPPSRTCTLEESVLVRMALPTAAYAGGTALCLELV